MGRRRWKKRVTGYSSAKRRLRRLADLLMFCLLAGIALLYVVSVPWYRVDGADSGLWLGLPEWVSVAALCYAAAAVLNSLAWLATDVRDARGEREE